LPDDTEWDAIMEEFTKRASTSGAYNLLIKAEKETMTASITVEEAQTKLKDLIHGMVPGEEVVITENQQPVARLVSEPVKPTRPAPGLGKGSIIYMAPDFDGPIEEMKEYME
jgi:antitoxin (DNA-binding transcriptional repressor) of toxin-antitoxin stability system